MRLSSDAARVTGSLISTVPSFDSMDTDEAWEASAEAGAEDCVAGVVVPEEQAARPSAAMAAIAAREVVVRDILLRKSWGNCGDASG